MDNTSVELLMQRLAEINKQLDTLHEERHSIQDKIKCEKIKTVDEEFTKCNVTDGMYLALFSSNTTDYTLVKTLAIQHVSSENRCVDCIEGSYVEYYDGYIYRTDVEHMSFQSFLEHKDRYNMYVCSKDQFDCLQLILCAQHISRSNMQEYELAVNCAAINTIS